jgi:hypothetical protein
LVPRLGRGGGVCGAPRLSYSCQLCFNYIHVAEKLGDSSALPLIGETTGYNIAKCKIQGNF